MRTRALLLAALALAAPAGALGRRPRTPEGRTMDWKNQGNGPAQPGHLLVSGEPVWLSVWKRLGQAAPPLDFKTHIAVAVFVGERPTGGWTVDWSSEAKGDDLVVRFAIKKPRGMATQAFTRPWAVRAFPRPKGRVVVEDQGEK